MADEEESIGSEMRRLARGIAQMDAEIAFFQEMLEIVENNIAGLNERDRLREETRESWTMEYYDMADQFVESGTYGNDDDTQVDANVSPTTRIRQLDREIADLAILAAELAPFLPEDEQQGKGKKVETRVENEGFVPSSEEEIVVPNESEKKDSNYIHFVIVDEHGQPLGAVAADGQESEAAANVSKRSGGGYITMHGADSDSEWRSAELAASTDISVARTEQPDEQGHPPPSAVNSPASSMRTAAADSESEPESPYRRPNRDPTYEMLRDRSTPNPDSPPRSPSPVRVDRRGRVLVGFDSTNARSAGELNQLEQRRHRDQSPTGVSTSRGQYQGSWRAEAQTIRQTSVDNSQSRDSVLAYSMLNDENNIVYIPILPDEDDRDEQEPSTAAAAAVERPQLSEAQRLWQAELDASSGNIIRYTLPPDHDQANRTPTGIISTSAGRSNSGNLQRSLLHRVLGDPRPSISKK